MRQYGITLIEVMIGIVFLVIIGLAVFGYANPNMSSISFGFNGITETRCISGYQHTVGSQGQARQILDENGRGISC